MRHLLFLLVVAGGLLAACRDSIQPVAPTLAPPRFSMVTDVTMTDLGTLGGTSSSAVALNNVGQVIGSSLMPGDATSHAFLWQNGTMIDLGTLGGWSRPMAVSEAGQVIGVSETADGGRHAFRWQNGTMTDLGNLGMFDPKAVNHAGQFVGTYPSRNGHAVLWQNGTMTDLGTLGGTLSAARVINDAGQVAGWSMTADNDNISHGFVWQSGTMTDLGTLGSVTEVTAINDAGQVVGWMGDVGFLWQNGTLINLHAFPGSSGLSYAFALNNVGQVVGAARTADDFEHAFLWQNGAMTDVGASHRFSWSWAWAINDAGQVLGNVCCGGDGQDYNFVWENGTLTALVGLPVAINNAGQIVGNAGGHAALWNTRRLATPAEEVSILTSMVNTLVANHTLRLSDAQPLLNMLANAANQLNKGHDVEAANVLQYGFIQKVQDEVRLGILSTVDGQTLINAAQNAINQLRAAT